MPQLLCAKGIWKYVDGSEVLAGGADAQTQV